MSLHVRQSPTIPGAVARSVNRPVFKFNVQKLTPKTPKGTKDTNLPPTEGTTASSQEDTSQKEPGEARAELDTREPGTPTREPGTGAKDHGTSPGDMTGWQQQHPLHVAELTPTRQPLSTPRAVARSVNRPISNNITQFLTLVNPTRNKIVKKIHPPHHGGPCSR